MLHGPGNPRTNTFAFVIHPPTLRHAARVLPVLKLMPHAVAKSFLRAMPPVFVSRMRHVRSIVGTEVTGVLVACPLLPKQMLELPVEFVLDKIVGACRIGERMHAGIVGLGGYTSIAGDKGITVARRSRIAVTSGSSGTAWSACSAIRRLARQQGMNLASAQLAVVGATGAIGSLVCRSLASAVGAITLVARHREKLEALAAALGEKHTLPVAIELDARRAVRDADLVVLTTSAPEALLKPPDFKSGSIVGDISVPPNVTGRFDARSDVTIVEAGRVRLPFPAGLSADIATRPGVVYACMAETVLLALEGRFESLSLGDQIPLENMEIIGALAEKHGFQVDLPRGA
jgi:predicted amino acid dehydrogenase